MILPMKPLSARDTSFSERSLAPVVTGLGRSVLATSASMFRERVSSGALDILLYS